MQDMRSAGGDRRLRQHSHLAGAALKCPRCDSLNTKFCYYNNYNLSQPRYFCKNCRRYWTKGGVLRNVPVGGGCRKTKRTKQKSTAAERSSNARSSSSESSSLTAATTTVTTPTSAVAEQSSTLNATSSSSAMASSFPDSRLLNANPSYDYPVNRTTDSGQIFPADIGSFANLATSFGVGNISTASYGQGHKGSRGPGPANPSSGSVGSTAVEELKMQEITVEMGNGVGLAALDWGGVVGGGGGRGDQDQELFDLTAAVDPAYWSQPHDWTDGGDQSLNFLS